MKVALNTLLAMELFKEKYLDSFLLHIPHASTHLPDLTGFLIDRVEENKQLLTDWATDQLFKVEGMEAIVTPFSRLFCDVERLEDEDEPMLEVGRGFYYTHGYDGAELRTLDAQAKEQVYRDYYLRHHEWFNELATAKLEKHGVCHIIDCHSFNDNPLVPFLERPKSPDICIGTDPFHTPDYLVNPALHYFAELGYTVEVNNPYAGSIVPKQYYNKEKRVKSMMIEVNKRLYMEGDQVDNAKVTHLNQVIKGYFNAL
jgi:N-formylglutamate amidohydrolase